MTSSTALPQTMYKRRFRRSDNKFKWYLILAISIVFIVLAITVIGLTIYLTSENGIPGNTQARIDVEDVNSGRSTPASKTTDSTIHKTQTTTVTTQTTTVATPKVLTLVPQTTRQTAKPTETTTVKFSTSVPSSSTGLDGTTTLPTVTTEKTTRQTAKPTETTTVKFSTSVPSSSTGLDGTTTLPTVTTEKVTTTKSTTKRGDTTTPQQRTTKQATSLSTTAVQLESSTQKPTTTTSQSISTSAVTSSTTGSSAAPPPTTTQVLQTSTTEFSKSITTPTASPTNATYIPSIKLSGQRISSTLPFLLTCEVKNVPGWIDLQIYRHYGQNQSGLVAQMTAGAIVPTVIVIDESLTFSASHHSDAITMILVAQSFTCNHAGSYSCSVSSASMMLKDQTEVKVAENVPEIFMPLGVIEGRTMSLDCVIEYEGTAGDIKWTFSPPGFTNTFYDLSIVPDTKNTTQSCTIKLESKFTFTPGMYDNGSHFRCEVVNAQGYNGTTILQRTVPFLVIEETFCRNRIFTLQNHPYQPCGKIVYCSDIGPIVYEINCPNPGYCYDATTTKCVPEKDLGI